MRGNNETIEKAEILRMCDLLLVPRHWDDGTRSGLAGRKKMTSPGSLYSTIMIRGKLGFGLEKNLEEVLLKGLSENVCLRNVLTEE